MVYNHNDAGSMNSQAEANDTIVRKNLYDEVAAKLRQMITSGQLLPGWRIPERQLCETLGVSRTPLREALRVLAAEGLVVLNPNRGAQVRQITREEAEHVIEVMQALEGFAAELACKRMEDAGITEIAALHYKMKAHYQRRELQSYFELNRQIHERLIEGANNPLLTATYHNLGARIYHLRYRTHMSEEEWERAMLDHEAILKWLMHRDAEKLSSVLRGHLYDKFGQMVRSGFAPMEDGSDQAEQTQNAAIL